MTNGQFIFWLCCCECHHKWPGAENQNLAIGQDPNVVTQKNYTAKATLDSFHLVLVTELLHLPRLPESLLEKGNENGHHVRSTMQRGGRQAGRHPPCTKKDGRVLFRAHQSSAASWRY